MARLPRLYLPGCAQHVIQRGNNRELCFYNDADYKVYLAFLRDSAAKYSVDIHAYVLMSNHVHLLVTPGEERGLGRMMQALGRRYVRYFNDTYCRTGTLWEGRYKSTLVDTDRYLLTVYRYIELNPVRAGMVNHPSEYPWSSYQCNALGEAAQLITPHTGYCQLGVNARECRRAYRALFRGRIRDSEITAIRESTNKAWVLGGERLKAQVKSETGRRPSPLGRGGDRKSAVFREARDQTL